MFAAMKIVAILAGNWISIDRDGDGRISRSEFTAVGSGEIAATPRP